MVWHKNKSTAQTSRTKLNEKDTSQKNCQINKLQANNSYYLQEKKLQAVHTISLPLI